MSTTTHPDTTTGCCPVQYVDGGAPDWWCTTHHQRAEQCAEDAFRPINRQPI